jgi:hypothetical protein
MRQLIIVFLGIMTLAACATPGVRLNNAQRLAGPVFMLPRTATIDNFQIKLYERMHTRGGATARVYIEDSGEVLDRGFNPTKDPTPLNPIGLVLASHDPSPDVIYMARPCQFGSKKPGADECPLDVLKGRVFAPEMIALTNGVLDDIKKRYRVQNFELIGFGTGGGLATILAGERDDVVSLRTVAGVLDTITYAKAHELSGYEASLNPINSVPKLITMPQHHYLAQLDDRVPNLVYHSFAQAFGDNRCLDHTLVQNVDHRYDWGSVWTGLVRAPVTCLEVQRPRMVPTEDVPMVDTPLPVVNDDRPAKPHFMQPLVGQ